MTYYTKRKADLVKIELHVPRATYGNYEKLRQKMKYEDVPTTILHVMHQKIRQILGSHYVPVPKDLYDILTVKAREKNMELCDLTAEILQNQLKEEKLK